MEAPLDVEAAVAEFLRDPARTSLELPPMAAAQRKLAKAAADRHPELTCESFGLGTERRLHLFKQGSAPQGAGGRDAGAGSVSVKNTFIDDWISPAGGEDGAEPVVFRSMPPQLPQASVQHSRGTALSVPSCLLAGGGKLDLSPINEGSPKWPSEAAIAGAAARAVAASELPSWAASAAGRGAHGTSGERTEGDGAQPTLLEGFQVRNTFIHIDCMPPDERSVQSMPHDMFRQCLEEEAGRLSGLVAAASRAPARGGGDASTRQPVAMPPAAAPQGDPSQQLLAPGVQVVVQGLTKLPAFNGQTGIIECLDEATGRYSVLLSSAKSGTGAPQRAKVKMENLRPVALMPPPPPFAPALDRLSMAMDPLGAYGGLAGLPSMPSTPLWAEDAFAPSPLRLTELV